MRQLHLSMRWTTLNYSVGVSRINHRILLLKSVNYYAAMKTTKHKEVDQRLCDALRVGLFIINTFSVHRDIHNHHTSEVDAHLPFWKQVQQLHGIEFPSSYGLQYRIGRNVFSACQLQFKSHFISSTKTLVFSMHSIIDSFASYRTKHWCQQHVSWDTSWSFIFSFWWFKRIE